MEKNKIKSFVETIFDDMASAMTAGLGYVGVKTGLFKTMQGQGALVALHHIDDLLAKTGI